MKEIHPCRPTLCGVNFHHFFYDHVHLEAICFHIGLCGHLKCIAGIKYIPTMKENTSVKVKLTLVSPPESVSFLLYKHVRRNSFFLVLP